MQTAQKPSLKTFKLLRNYRPSDGYEVVGWHKPRVVRKDAAGKEHVISEAEFIKGEMAPPPFPGVGFPGKVWAGTVIRIPEAEAKIARSKGIGELEFD